MNIGEKIYQLRTEKNLSQGDLADMLQVSRQSVSKWENDTAVPDLDKLIKLGDVFEISLDELVGREKKIEKSQSKLEKFKNSLTKTQFSGCVFILISILSAIIPFIRFLAVPSVACGIICLLVKKYAWYWCIWAAYLPLRASASYLFVISMFLGDFLLYILRIAEIVFMIVMAVVTYRYLKDIKFNFKQTTKIILLLLSAVSLLAYIAWYIFSGIELYSEPNGSGTSLDFLTYTIFNPVLTALFGAAMIYMVSYIREARQKK